MERLQQAIEFILTVDKLKTIGRQTYISDGTRKENDAEHSFHLALMTALLSEYANEPIDVLKTMKMVLIHDVVEVEAGDTYCYDEQAKQDQALREQKAADRLFALLPNEQFAEYRALWQEFEDKNTPESRFANTMDRLQPLLLNIASHGRSWKEHGICATQVRERMRSMFAGSETLGNYGESIIQKAVSDGLLPENK